MPSSPSSSESSSQSTPPPGSQLAYNRTTGNNAKGKKSRPRVQDDFDGAWKNMLTERRFRDFIAFFMPDLVPLIDWSQQPTFLEQELRAVTRKTKKGNRSVDRLVRVWLTDGTEQWIIVHIEIQMSDKEDFTERMFRYFFRSFDLFDGKPILSLAVLADDNPAWRPSSYTKRYLSTSVDFHFATVKLLDYLSQQEQLETSDNPFARFVLAHLKTLETREDYESRLAWKLRIIKGLYEMGVSEEEIGQLGHDFDWLLALPASMQRTYHKEIVRYEEEKSMPHMSTAEKIGRQDGKREGRIEGKIEGIQDSILELIEVRFGIITPELREQLEGIHSVEQLKHLRRALYEGLTLHEFEVKLRD